MPSRGEEGVYFPSLESLNGKIRPARMNQAAAEVFTVALCRFGSSSLRKDLTSAPVDG